MVIIIIILIITIEFVSKNTYILTYNTYIYVKKVVDQECS